MNEHIENARDKADEIYTIADEYKAQAAPHVDRAASFLNKHIDKILMSALVAVEIWQGESLDNIEEASNVSAAVDYDNYTKG
jgi:S-methylmethionine-dependent homocysteine/selenocysteine methylase